MGKGLKQLWDMRNHVNKVALGDQLASTQAPSLLADKNYQIHTNSPEENYLRKNHAFAPRAMENRLNPPSDGSRASQANSVPFGKRLRASFSYVFLFVCCYI